MIAASTISESTFLGKIHALAQTTLISTVKRLQVHLVLRRAENRLSFQANYRFY